MATNTILNEFLQNYVNISNSDALNESFSWTEPDISRPSTFVGKVHTPGRVWGRARSAVEQLFEEQVAEYSKLTSGLRGILDKFVTHKGKIDDASNELGVLSMMVLTVLLCFTGFSSDGPSFLLGILHLMLENGISKDDNLFERDGVSSTLIRVGDKTTDTEEISDLWAKWFGFTPSTSNTSLYLPIMHGQAGAIKDTVNYIYKRRKWKTNNSKVFSIIEAITNGAVKPDDGEFKTIDLIKAINPATYTIIKNLYDKRDEYSTIDGVLNIINADTSKVKAPMFLFLVLFFGYSFVQMNASTKTAGRGAKKKIIFLNTLKYNQGGEGGKRAYDYAKRWSTQTLSDFYVNFTMSSLCLFTPALSLESAKTNSRFTGCGGTLVTNSQTTISKGNYSTGFFYVPREIASTVYGSRGSRRSLRDLMSIMHRDIYTENHAKASTYGIKACDDYNMGLGLRTERKILVVYHEDDGTSFVSDLFGSAEASVIKTKINAVKVGAAVNVVLVKHHNDITRSVMQNSDLIIAVAEFRGGHFEDIIEEISSFDSADKKRSVVGAIKTAKNNKDRNINSGQLLIDRGGSSAGDASIRWFRMRGDSTENKKDNAEIIADMFAWQLIPFSNSAQGYGRYMNKLLISVGASLLRLRKYTDAIPTKYGYGIKSLSAPGRVLNKTSSPTVDFDAMFDILVGSGTVAAGGGATMSMNDIQIDILYDLVSLIPSPAPSKNIPNPAGLALFEVDEVNSQFVRDLMSTTISLSRESVPKTIEITMKISRDYGEMCTITPVLSTTTKQPITP